MMITVIIGADDAQKKISPSGVTVRNALANDLREEFPGAIIAFIPKEGFGDPLIDAAGLSKEQEDEVVSMVEHRLIQAKAFS